MAFIDETREIIRLAQVWATEENAEAEESGFTRLSERLGQPPKASWQATHDRIEQLSEVAHYKLLTIMYAGRERRTDFRDIYEDLSSRFDGAYDARRQATEKIPLGDYLEVGLSLAAKVGLDVNQPFG